MAKLTGRNGQEGEAIKGGGAGLAFGSTVVLIN